MSKLKFFWAQSWLLIVSAFFFGLLLAVTNAAWGPKILENEQREINLKMTALLPEAVRFEHVADVDINLGKGKTFQSDVLRAVSDANEYVGWVFDAEGVGFADKIKVIVAVDKNFENIAGIDFAAINETPGFGDRANQPAFRNQFARVPADALKLVKIRNPKNTDSEIVAITGATVTSTGVVNAVNNAMKPIKEYLLTNGLIQNAK